MKPIKQLNFTEFDFDININPEDKKDLSECAIFFEGEGEMIRIMNRTSEFLSTIPKGKYTIYKTGGTHRLAEYSGREDFPFIVNNFTNKQIDTIYSKGNYPVVNIRAIPGKHTIKTRKGLAMHRLAGMAFIENPMKDKLNLIDHINEDKFDYSVNNLKWVNNSMNMKNIKNTISNTPHKVKVLREHYE